MIWIKRLFVLLRWSLLLLLVCGFLFVGFILFYIEDDLPDVAVLKDIQLQVPMRIFTSDGKLIAEYGQNRRIPIPFEEMPSALINAVLATEDQRFFEHPGVDIFGLLRASVYVALTHTKAQGGSTITMQVARNFFLTRKKTFSRKLKEILLAIKIDNELSKEKILDLYLNQIYFGNRAYGVGAAAYAYYGKSLRDLTLPELAMIAGLPKAPSTLNPIKNPEAARARRNHVLKRMHEQQYIDDVSYQSAIEAPITARYHGLPISAEAPYVAEMVRSILVNQYGEQAYTLGLNAYLTINAQAQEAANQAVRNALLAYDRRHGYRGPLKNLGTPQLNELSTWLVNLKTVPEANRLQPAAIINVNPLSAAGLLKTGEVVILSWDGLSWARQQLKDNALGPKPKDAHDILRVGDVVYVEKMANDQWYLAQPPEIEGALVALNPQTGAIQALVGGFDYQESNYNRATQAKRQPGSSFKPFIYAAALDKGFTLASVINDAPVVITNPYNNELWRPQNYTRRFYGPTRLREGLVKSRNLVSIRLLDATGLSYTLKYLTRFGFDPGQMPHALSLALGTGAVTPLELAAGYAVFANGGYKVSPYLIDYITNDKGEFLYQSKPKMACKNCLQANVSTPLFDPTMAEKYAPQTVPPQIAYLITDALHDVITQGTGRDVLKLGLNRADLAGKTGTTNDQKDAWFAGYNSDSVAIAWVGFDYPSSLHEYATQAALPLWVNFMKVMLNNQPENPLPRPPGLITLPIDPATGRLTSANQKNAINELFLEERTPPQRLTVTTPATNATSEVSAATSTVPGPQDNNTGETEDDDAIARIF